MKRALSWFKRAQSEGPVLTLERIFNRLKKRQVQHRRKEWLSSVIPHNRGELDLQTLLPGTEQGASELLNNLRLSRMHSVEWMTLHVLGIETGKVLERADAIIGRDLTSVHPLFSPRKEWMWHEAFGGAEDQWPPNLSRMEPISGENCPGDIRISWEKGRHQFLITLLWAQAHTGELRYLEEAISVMEDWGRNNPFPSGIHWRDAQEVGLRLKVWLRILCKASSEPSLTPRVEALLPTLVAHGRYLEHFTSFGPDTHNHLITELCARLHFRYVFDLPSPPISVEELEKHLLTQIRKQFWADGSPGEGSVNYHLFVLEALYELYVHALCRRPVFASALHGAIAPLVTFALTMIDEYGHWPQIGDTDGGMGSGLFCLQECQDRTPLKNALAVHWSITQGQKPLTHFHGLGITALQHPADEARVYMMLGPKKQRPGVHRSHHQADRLSMVLKKGPETLLADPGTYAYNGSMAERVRDRQTSAHNSPGIEGVSQMDVSTYRFGVGALPSRSNDWVKNDTDLGIYSIGASIRVATATVRREWYWCPDDALLLIVDQWQSEEFIKPEVWWHAGPTVNFRQQTEQSVSLHLPNRERCETTLMWSSYDTRFNPVFQRDAEQGAEISPRVATRYGLKTPIETIRLTPKEDVKESTLYTLLSLCGDIWEARKTSEGLIWVTPQTSRGRWACSSAGLLTRNDCEVRQLRKTDS